MKTVLKCDEMCCEIQEKVWEIQNSGKKTARGFLRLLQVEAAVEP